MRKKAFLEGVNNMISEIRNELLGILSLMKSEDKQFKVEMLLERFEIDINNQLEEIKSKEATLKENLKTLEYVKKELGIK